MIEAGAPDADIVTVLLANPYFLDKWGDDLAKAEAAHLYGPLAKTGGTPEIKAGAAARQRARLRAAHGHRGNRRVVGRVERREHSLRDRAARCAEVGDEAGRRFRIADRQGVNHHLGVELLERALQRTQRFEPS